MFCAAARRAARWFTTLLCLGSLALPAAGDSPAMPEHRMVADSDGTYLHVAHYRPPGPPSGVVLLIHDWGSSGSQCWGSLAGEIAAAGFEVIVPDLPGHGRSLVPELLQPVPSVPSRADAVGMSRRAAAWLSLAEAPSAPAAVACVGWAGLLLPHLLGETVDLHAIVWVAPPGDPRTSDLESSEAMPPFLLVASQEDVAGSRVAEALFSRFNARAELRVFRRGPAGCGLLALQPVRAGLLAWLRETLSAAARASTPAAGRPAP